MTSTPNFNRKVFVMARIVPNTHAGLDIIWFSAMAMNPSGKAGNDPVRIESAWATEPTRSDSNCRTNKNRRTNTNLRAARTTRECHSMQCHTMACHSMSSHITSFPKKACRLGSSIRLRASEGVIRSQIRGARHFASRFRPRIPISPPDFARSQ